MRIGHWNGFDLSTTTGARRLMMLWRQKKPRRTVMSPPCGPFSQIQNINQRSEDQIERLRLKKAKGRRILQNMATICQMVLNEPGCHLDFEQPQL
jgi:hypothetical protein